MILVNDVGNDNKEQQLVTLGTPFYNKSYPAKKQNRKNE
jgi:hypothetical protein